MGIIKHYPDILDCIANLSNDEVFTPPTLANKVLDLLPKEVWSNPNLKWLDPCCKTGVFLREIAKRLWIGLAKEIPNEDKRREHIFHEMLWGIALTELTALTSRRSLYYSKNPNSFHSVVPFVNKEGNIFYNNIEHTFKNNECEHCGINDSIFSKRTTENNELHAYNFIHADINDILKGTNMKFDVIVGNPPYQINTSEDKPNAIPIYHLFIEKAKEMNPQYICMITPSRWFAGGSSKLTPFREKMRTDFRIKKIVDFPDASECFPGVEIEGGVNYFLWDKYYNGPCDFISMQKNTIKSQTNRYLNEFDVIIRHNEAISIIHKVDAVNKIIKNTSITTNTLENIISSQTPYGFLSNFSNYSKTQKTNHIRLYTSKEKNNIVWVDKSLIKKNIDWIDYYQVFVPEALGGAGKFPYKVIGTPINAGKNVCCTQTYLVFGKFKTQLEADNFVSYLNTKFVRFLIALRKNTQHINPTTVSFVPIPDLSINYTDAYLYKKYDLAKEEIELIDKMIK